MSCRLRYKWIEGTFQAPDGTVSGSTECAANELPISSIREGEVPGIHSIRYDSEADSITITHDAKNRRGFALGAVLAAEYTAKHEGALGMSDLFPFLKDLNIMRKATRTQWILRFLPEPPGYLLTDVDVKNEG